MDSRPEHPMPSKQTPSLAAYAVIVLIVLVTYFTGRVFLAGQPGIRLIGWDTFLLLALGLAAVWAQPLAGLPALVDERVSGWQRWGLPAVVGAGFGAADVLVWEVLTPHSPYQSLPPFTQPFPYSLLLFTSGAVYVEVLHRLLPLTVILLIAGRLLPEAWQNRVFWIAAILTSLWEPLEQWPAASLLRVIYALGSGFAFNLLQALFYRRSGWLAALSTRLGHYAIWHILLGLWIEFVVLG